MSLKEILKNEQVIAILCGQWGDSGKGKITDYFSYHWADVVARATGGNNAGHTVIVNNKKRIFHSIPSGILSGKIAIMGRGMVINLESLIEELNEIEKDITLTPENLMISKHAHIILPHHITIDREISQSQEEEGIGSTGRGIGPCYADKHFRLGVTIEDLFDLEILARKIRKLSEFYPDYDINPDEIIDKLRSPAEKIKPFVKEVSHEIHEFYKKGKKILLEGAQGLLLSIEHGTYKYVTSSCPSLNGTANGVGLPANVVCPIQVFKFPFMTRVGGGPFPTELGGKDSEERCRNKTLEEELKEFRIPYTKKNNEIAYDRKDEKIIELMNSKDPLIKGIGIRLAGEEYGATTKRPRRTGWTDCVSAKYSTRINDLKKPKIILTKPDCLSGIKEFELCFKYAHGEKETSNFCKSEGFLKSSKPVYKSYEGYDGISEITSYEKLPPSFLKAAEDFARFVEGEIVAVSNGPEREQLIIK